MKSSQLNGLVLAGGRSSRMGKDKGLIQYHQKPQLNHLFDLLGKFCDRVYTSCREDQGIPTSRNPIYDKFDFESPLNGILSAMDKYSKKSWLAIAVDMPYVNEDVLHYLISHRDRAKVATCFYDSEGKNPEPLLTIWESSAFQSLKKFNKTGGISPRGFLMANDCAKLNYPDAQIHININTPKDILKLKA